MWSKSGRKVVNSGTFCKNLDLQQPKCGGADLYFRPEKCSFVEFRHFTIAFQRGLGNSLKYVILRSLFDPFPGSGRHLRHFCKNPDLQQPDLCQPPQKCLFYPFCSFPPLFARFAGLRPRFQFGLFQFLRPPAPGALKWHFREIASSGRWLGPFSTVPHASTFTRVLQDVAASLPTAGRICTFLGGKCNSALESARFAVKSGLGTRGFGGLPESAQIPAPHGGARDLQQDVPASAKKRTRDEGRKSGSRSPISGTFRRCRMPSPYVEAGFAQMPRTASATDSRHKVPGI